MLERIVIDDAVGALRPDFTVLMIAEGRANGPSVDALLRRGELPEINQVVAAGEEPAALPRAISPDVVIGTRLIAP